MYEILYIYCYSYLKFHIPLENLEIINQYFQ